MWKKGSAFVLDAEALVAKNVRECGNFFIATALNMAIKRGASVASVPVHRMFSLRTQAEVSDFKDFLYASNHESMYQLIYDDMTRRWADVTRSYVADLESTRCNAAYQIVRDGDVVGDFNEVVRGFDHHLVYRPGCNLHFTFLKLNAFGDGSQLSEEFVNVFDAAVTGRLKPFTIKFTRIIVTDVSILAVGIPSSDINQVRVDVAAAMKPCEMRVYGRSPLRDVLGIQNICHVTLVRFTKPLETTELARLSKLHGSRLSTGPVLRVSQLTLSDATLAMMPAHLVFRPSWTVRLG